MFFEKNGHININLLGIKIKFKKPSICNYLKNEVYIVDNKGNKKRTFFPVKGVKINFLGNNAKIYLPKDRCFKNCKFSIGANTILTIKKPHIWGINNLFVELFGYDNKVTIGENFNCVSGTITNCGGNNPVVIEDDCMFSTNFLIRTHDGHAIYDNLTKEPINEPKSVKIGKHCWFGQDVTILKGVEIKDNSMVATNSVVTKSIEQSNVIIAGNPARVVKTGINWDRDNYYNYLAKIKGEDNA